MLQILIIDPDPVVTACVVDALKPYNVGVTVVHEARGAVAMADRSKPDLVICELSLAGHSGLEFLYEFRTYPDWADIPIAVYTSVKVPEKIMQTHDWKYIGISRYFYKPTATLDQLVDWVVDTLDPR